MSDATDKFQAMLDERGVEYTKTIVTEGVLFTVVTSEGHYFILVRDNDAGIEMWSQYFTPEQAIAATLGTGTCHDKNGFDPDIGFECTACGTMVDRYMVTPLDMGHEVQFRFCPNCRRRVVGDQRCGRHGG